MFQHPPLVLAMSVLAQLGGEFIEMNPHFDGRSSDGHGLDGGMFGVSHGGNVVRMGLQIGHVLKRIDMSGGRHMT